MVAAIINKRDYLGSQFETGSDGIIVRAQGRVRKSIQMDPPNLLKDTASSYYGPTNSGDETTTSKWFRTTLPTIAQPFKSVRALRNLDRVAQDTSAMPIG
jgi:hypothetical protein